MHLFAEGRHFELAKVFGAQAMLVEGVPGVRFALWAPNARRVSVVGDFNGWDGRRHPMRRRAEAGVWEIMAVTLAEIMADTGHYSIDSTTVRAHVSAAGGKGGLVDALLAARGAGSPVSFTAWLMPSAGRSPFT
jgi:hypothetical protein